MDIERLPIDGVVLIRPRRIGDSRGFFAETFRRDRLVAEGLPCDFVQENHSLSRRVGTLRGLHYQLPPRAQAKLVRVVRGAILDVAVDIRRGSPSYGGHVKAVLSAENGHQLLVPVGFAHGFVTLEPDTEVVYKVSDVYAPAEDRGVLWSDPALGVGWGVASDAVHLSDKDRALPPLAAAENPFLFEAATA
ncbi:dTDP-4-dehydrorhamnose 3,5-epimerase [Prosthecomicrobium pneumaticum]|uniref:dTDP-4-dehydrorhamnose 3,5-epimerase n=1 Tax=Prosthecomicrobium pneumaticum TaxID=81895 RepID=A0A7W9CVK9_9HYPH|nr:dTDP-4-dehydrorhamnose 3,5-epimerase [Prosthecomicrobium pneumaticum]MBB5752403.1 dTDP-4-dehydrorhamnose 3,5-epimerase [Prosthecomicrobium pneumaticum]